MNKLIITGNGFDLAHGLKTKYTDFLDYLWKKIIRKEDCHLIRSLAEYNDNNVLHEQFLKFNSYKDITNKFLTDNLLIKESRRYHKIYKNRTTLKPTNQDILETKSELFTQILEQSIQKGWTDIENVYYQNLKKSKNFNVSTLNTEFETLTKLFERYLSDEVVPKIDLKFLENRNNTEKIRELFGELDSKTHTESTKDNSLLFLDFNYTPTVDCYIKYNESKKSFPKIENFQIEHIQIHGEINNPENIINFGFGDEMDEEYKQLENLNDNDYLKNIKSFKYLLNNKYRNLMNFINSGPYTISIMGHSCGLSDRTLLKTIFENPNCISLKVYYFENQGNDNFTEITQNISRHFSLKESFREKLTDKSLSTPLPQLNCFKHVTDKENQISN